MQFKCGPSKEKIALREQNDRADWDRLRQKNAKKIADAQVRETYYKNWHPWFALWPVPLINSDGKCVWLQRVYRRYNSTHVNSLYGGLSYWWPIYTLDP